MFHFRPKDYRISIFEIDYEALHASGIRSLFFDIDNTILPYDKSQVPDRAKELIFHLKELGFTVWILSNGRKERVQHITGQLGIRGIWRAGKPFIFKFRQALRASGFLPYECAVIGDQVFADVLTANAEGAYSILVRPISLKKDEAITRVKRPLERLLLRLMDLTPIRMKRRR